MFDDFERRLPSPCAPNALSLSLPFPLHPSLSFFFLLLAFLLLILGTGQANGEWRMAPQLPLEFQSY